MGLTSNTLAAVGLLIQTLVSFVVSYISDRYNNRGQTVISIISMALVTCSILNTVFTEVRNQSAQHFGVVRTQIWVMFARPLNITWMSLTGTDSKKRAPVMAMVVMGTNPAGICGA